MESWKRQRAFGRDVLISTDKHMAQHIQSMYAISLNHVALVQMKMRAYDPALSNLKEASHIMEASVGTFHPNYAAVARNIADCLMSLQRFEDSLEWFETCRKSREQSLGDQHPEFCDTLVRMSQCLLHLQRAEEASSLSADAAARTLNLLLKVFAVLPEAKQTVCSQKYADAALLLPATWLKLKHLPEEAVWYAMLRKCLRWDLQAYCTYTHELSANLEPGTELMDAQCKLADLACGSSPDKQVRAQVMQLVARIEELESNIQGYRKPRAEWLEEICPRHNLFQQMEQKLQPHQALIEYLVYSRCYSSDREGHETETRYCALLWTPKRTGEKSGPVLIDLEKTSDVDGLVREFQLHMFSMQRSIIQEGRDAGRRLRQAILDPVLRKLPLCTTFLHISPDGKLSNLAFCCLPSSSEEGYLLHDFTLKYLWAGRQLIKPAPRVDKDVEATGRRVLIFANPHFESEPSLPYTQVEADGLQKLLNGEDDCKLLCGDEATRAAFLSSIDSFRPSILHVATSGHYDEQQQVKESWTHDGSGITSTECQSNPLLQLSLSASHGERITGLHLRGRSLNCVQLAVFSCCLGARGDIVAGDGIVGLAYALSAAGARNVLMSLTQLDDKVTVASLVA